MLPPSINTKSLNLLVRLLKLDAAYRGPGTITSDSREVLLGTLLIAESSREFLVPPAALEVETQLCRVRPRRDEVRSAERR